jgi:hypothetical protein
MKVMNYKHILAILTFLSLFLIPLTLAAEVGVVVDFPDQKTHIECIQTSSGTNGYNLLRDLSISTLWSSPGSFGHQLCKVKGTGDDVSGNSCSYSGQYWRFLIQKNNNWDYMPVGVDGGSECWNGDFATNPDPFAPLSHYCARDGDVIGLSYGEFDDPLPSTKTFDEICNTLEISDVKVYVDGKRESDADEDGGDIEAFPGSELKIKVEVENLGDIEVEDIDGEIIIRDIDDGSDIDESLNFKDLEEGNEDDDTISFLLPLILEDNDYNMELEITFKINGNKQTINLDYDIEIEKEKHDLVIVKKELSPESICPTDQSKLELEIANIGEKDEEVLLTISNEELNIDIQEKFDLDEGDEDDSVYQKEFFLNIPNISPGEYELEINLDYSEDVREDLTLTIEDCDQPSNLNQLITGKAINPLSKNSNQKSSTNNNPNFFVQDNAIVIILVVFIIIFILAIIFIISMLR